MSIGASVGHGATVASELARLLFVEDDDADVELGLRTLSSEGFDPTVQVVDTEAAFTDALNGFDPQLILCDYNLPGWSGEDALHLARRLAPETPFIFLSGTLGEEVAVHLLREGAWDYVLKDRPARLGDSVRRALSVVAENAALKAADEALRRSEELFRTMLLELPAYSLITDLDGRVSFVNDALLAVIGYTREEVLGRVGSDFYAKEEDRESASAALAHTFASGTIIPRWENELPTRDGGRRLVRWSSAFLHRDGEVVGLASIGEDVSDQRVLEEQLRQSQRLEAVGQLTGGVAHDFNNLLTVILGNGELLTDALADRPEERELAAMAVQAAERGAELTRSLLAFARRQPLAPQSVDVDRLLAGLDSLLRRTLGEQVELEISGTGPLWQALIDPSQLEGAVLNLALNARDAMPDGGQLTIEIANTTLDADYAALNPEADPGPYVLVAVSDTGTGIDPGILARVFDPFFTTKQPGTGTGLGLSMVHGFVKQSGGHVKIYSEPGHGTTVRMYLPRATDPAEETEHTPTILVGGTETVLLVEDDDQVRQYAQHVLTALGYHVISAENGPQALAIITDRDDIDLLFTDIVMPGGMTGRQLADAAVAARPGLRVLYTSGYTQNAIVHNGRLDPGVHLLTKPYRRTDLAHALREALDQ